MQWQKPIYKYDSKVPITPTKEQAEAIISSAPSINSATIFRVLLESGFEGEELHGTIEQDIDTEQGIITIAGHKQHNGRKHKFKKATTEMLKLYISKHHRKHPFPRPKIMAEAWRKARAQTSQKLSRPDLNKNTAKRTPKPIRNHSLAENKRLRALEKKGYVRREDKKWYLRFKGIIAFLLILEKPRMWNPIWKEIFEKKAEIIEQASVPLLKRYGLTKESIHTARRRIGLNLDDLNNWVELSKRLITYGKRAPRFRRCQRRDIVRSNRYGNPDH
jgi:hypothetical protein